MSAAEAEVDFIRGYREPAPEPDPPAREDVLAAARRLAEFCGIESLYGWESRERTEQLQWIDIASEVLIAVREVSP